LNLDLGLNKEKRIFFLASNPAGLGAFFYFQFGVQNCGVPFGIGLML